MKFKGVYLDETKARAGTGTEGVGKLSFRINVGPGFHRALRTRKYWQ